MIRFERDRLRDGFGRATVVDLLERGLAAIDPRRVVSDQISLDGNRLRIGSHTYDVSAGRVWAIAIGKAAVPMAEAVSSRLGDALAGGIVVTRYGHGGAITGFRVFEAGHPIPDEGALRAAAAIEELSGSVGPGDLALCLLSGGGSALLAVPPAGVTIDDLARTTRLLIGSGAAIDEVNTVRRHLSTLLGGRLARCLQPARVATLALSDVPSDRPEAIASGPTVPDPTTFRDAVAVLRRQRLWERLPSSVRRALRPADDAETPRPGDPGLRAARFEIVASNRTLLDEIERAAGGVGCHVIRVSEPIVGQARSAGLAMARSVADLAAGGAARTLLVSGGETTVAVTGRGRGGRNQEFALAGAIELAGVSGVCVAALATDGSDGVTEAAGAIVDGETIDRIERAGIDPGAALDANDSHAALSAAEDVLWTGPTRTNVADAYVAFIDRS